LTRTDHDELSERPPDDASAGQTASWQPPVAASRLGVYAALGATAGAVPLPWVPDALARRVRGALVHDIASRHGLSLTRDARAVFSEPSGPDGPRGAFAQALRFVGAKVAIRVVTSLAPINVFWPARSALQTYVLGHLFDRYIEIARTERGPRIEVDEARRVRLAIDSALVRAVTVTGETARRTSVTDDQERDGVTALVDTVLGAAAGIPERLLSRIDAAFDDLLAHADG
jgi:hypothetical protein